MPTIPKDAGRVRNPKPTVSDQHPVIVFTHPEEAFQATYIFKSSEERLRHQAMSAVGNNEHGLCFDATELGVTPECVAAYGGSQIGRAVKLWHGWAETIALGCRTRVTLARHLSNELGPPA